MAAFSKWLAPISTRAILRYLERGRVKKTAVAKICMKPTELGGKTLPIGCGSDYSCPVFFTDVPSLSSHGYDCRLLLKQDNRSISPGEVAEGVVLAFLSPGEVFAHISVGTRFTLWEAGPIADGEITELGATELGSGRRGPLPASCPLK